MIDIIRDFLAAAQSVGAAGTMASAGIYLYHRGYATDENKRLLALISQQVTIPAYLFTTILYCEQDSSTNACVSIRSRLDNVWMLGLWPIYVVACGLLVGHCAAKISKTPSHHRPSVLAACAFGNSTGLPITLLSVIHARSSPNSGLGLVDPSLFLGIYLLMYPLLQWGVGGWLLAPQVKSESRQSCAPDHDNMMISGTLEMSNSPEISRDDIESYLISSDSAQYVLVCEEGVKDGYCIQTTFTSKEYFSSMLNTLKLIASNTFHPPVISAMLGLFVASINPLRGIFVDIVDRDCGAPLQWFFDGLYSIGRAAVPINMIILGINLAKTFRSSDSSDTELFSKETMISVVVAKMIIMPTIGIVSVLLLRNFVLEIPPEISASFYLVMVIVFLTPTANNVMVMSELCNGASKGGMARLIGWQYAVAPLILSISVAISVSIVNEQ